MKWSPSILNINVTNWASHYLSSPIIFFNRGQNHPLQGPVSIKADENLHSAILSILSVYTRRRHESGGFPAQSTRAQAHSTINMVYFLFLWIGWKEELAQRVTVWSDPKRARKMGYIKRSYIKYITPLKLSKTNHSL
jgi:hypothetical protein